MSDIFTDEELLALVLELHTAETGDNGNCLLDGSDGCCGWFPNEGELEIHRCDACEKFEDDATAAQYVLDTLRELGRITKRPPSGCPDIVDCDICYLRILLDNPDYPDPKVHPGEDEEEPAQQSRRRHIASCDECDLYDEEWRSCNLTDGPFAKILGATYQCEEGDCPYCDIDENGESGLDESCECVCHTQRVHPDCPLRKGPITFSLKLEET